MQTSTMNKFINPQKNKFIMETNAFKEPLVYLLIIGKYNDNEILHKQTFKANEILRTFQN